MAACRCTSGSSCPNSATIWSARSRAPAVTVVDDDEDWVYGTPEKDTGSVGREDAEPNGSKRPPQPRSKMQRHGSCPNLLVDDDDEKKNSIQNGRLALNQFRSNLMTRSSGSHSNLQQVLAQQGIQAESADQRAVMRKHRLATLAAAKEGGSITLQPQDARRSVRGLLVRNSSSNPNLLANANTPQANRRPARLSPSRSSSNSNLMATENPGKVTPKVQQMLARIPSMKGLKGKRRNPSNSSPNLLLASAGFSSQAPTKNAGWASRPKPNKLQGLANDFLLSTIAGKASPVPNGPLPQRKMASRRLAEPDHTDSTMDISTDELELVPTPMVKTQSTGSLNLRVRRSLSGGGLARMKASLVGGGSTPPRSLSRNNSRPKLGSRSSSRRALVQ